MSNDIKIDKNGILSSLNVKGQTYQNILPEPSLRNTLTDGEKSQKINEGHDTVRTVDGDFKSAVLSGETYQNILPEPSLRNTMVDGEKSQKINKGYDNVKTVEGEFKSVVLTGETYQNILPEPTLKNTMTNGKTSQKITEGYNDIHSADGVVKSVILSGDTMVNIMPEPTLRNTMTNGETLQKTNVGYNDVRTTDGDIKDVVLAGETLVNILPEPSLKNTMTDGKSEQKTNAGYDNVKTVDGEVKSVFLTGETYHNILPEPTLRNTMTNGKSVQKTNVGHDDIATADGDVKKMVLSGETLVNILPEPTLKNTMANGETYQPVTAGYDNIKSADGDVKSAIMAGETLVNNMPEPSLRNTMTNGKSKQKINEGYDGVNVVDGDIKSAVMTGDTLINILPKPSLQNTMTNGTSMQKTNAGHDTVKTIDGDVKNMVLSGETLVNIMPEPSLRNTMTDGKTIQKNDEGHDGVNVVDGEFKSAILKGNTLVNLIEINNPPLPSKVENGVITLDAKEEISFPLPLIKGDTKYLVKVDVLEVSENDPNKSISINHLDLNNLFTSHLKTPFVVGEYVFTAQTYANCRKSITIRNIWNETGKISFKVAIIEYQDCMENWDIPCFEGMQSVKMPVLKTCGKNLFFCEDYGPVIADDNWTSYESSLSNGTYVLRSIKYTVNRQSAISILTGHLYNAAHLPKLEGVHDKLRSSNALMLKGKKYTFSCKSSVIHPDGKNHAYVILFLDSLGNVINSRNNLGLITIRPNFTYTFTPTSNVHDIVVHIQYGTTWEFELTLRDIQIEEGSTATSYEPYKSQSVFPSEEVVLRSLPGGIKDTLNIKTGKYTKRINEVTFDGSSDENWAIIAPNSETIAFNWNVGFPGGANDHLNHHNTYMVCDKLTVQTGHDIWNKQDVFGIGGHQSSARIRLQGITTVEQLRDYLKANPVTVQYELEKPIISKVNLSYSGSGNWEHPMAFSKGYIQLSSKIDKSLIPSISYEVPTSNSYHMDLLKPSTLYTMKNMNGTFTIDGENIVVDNNTFTSPGTLTNKFLLTNDPQDKPMILEGNFVDKELPYFTGIQTVKSPVLKTCGKNLCGKVENNKDINYDTGDVSDGKRTIPTEFIPVKSNTYYTFTRPTMSDVSATRYYDKNKNYIGSTSLCLYGSYTRSFLTPSNCAFMKFVDASNTIEEGYQIEEGSVATSYEPHKSHILTVNDEDLELRKIGDVKDTLDLTTGEHVQCIGELTLDGSENWYSKWADWNGCRCFFIGGFADVKNNSTILSNRFIPVSGNPEQTKVAFSLGKADDWGKNSIIVTMPLNLLETPDVTGFKNWLSANPVKAYYIKNNPNQKSLVDLSITDQNGESVNKPKSFKDVYIHYSSAVNNSLVPHIDYEVPAENGYRYKVDLLKPSTVYTMKNVTGKFTIDGKEYDGSENSTFTSPEALTSKLMIVEDVQTKPMIIEGDVTTKELPYFEGMQSVHFPRVTLTNKIAYSSYKKISTVTNEKLTNGNISFTPTAQWARLYFVIDVDTSKEYFLTFKKLSTNALVLVRTGDVEIDSTIIHRTSAPIKFKSSKPKVTISVEQATTEMSKVSVDDLMVFEYQDGMMKWNIPYFEGTGNVKNSIVKLHNANFFDVKDGDLIIGRMNANGTSNPNNNYGIILREDLYLDVVPNTHCHLYGTSTSSLCQNLYFYDKDYKHIKTMNVYGLVPENAKYMKFSYIETGNQIFTQEDIKKVLSEGRMGYFKTYEHKYSEISPYKSSTLTTDEDLAFRKLDNDIFDELDLVSGKYVQKVGEFKPTKEMLTVHSTTETMHRINLVYSHIPNIKTNNQYTKKLCNLLNNTTDGSVIGIYSGGGAFLLSVDRNIAPTATDVIDWFIDNDLTILYELETPVVKTILSVIDQANKPSDKLQSFNNGYIELTNKEGTLVPTIKYEVPTSNSYHVDRLKPSTLYTMKNMNGTFTIDDNPYEGSANGTFTSPNVLTNKIILTTTEQDKPMIIEGNVTTKKLPYFTNMKSVENPVLSIHTGNIMRMNPDKKISDHRYLKMEEISPTEYLFTSTSREQKGVFGFLIPRNKRFSISFNYEKISGCTNGCSISVWHHGGVPDTVFLNDQKGKIFKSYWVFRDNKTTIDFKPCREVDSVPSVLKITNLKWYIDEDEVFDDKSSTLTLPQNISLRGFNNIYDTLDLSTGKLTRRVGEMIIDGRDELDWGNRWNNAGTAYPFNSKSVLVENYNFKPGGALVCEQLPLANGWGNNSYGILVNEGRGLVLVIPNELTGGPNNTPGLKKWLNKNPIKIQYELANPTVETIDLSAVNHNNQTTKRLQSFANSSIQFYSKANESLAPSISYEVPTKNSYYVDRLKPSTTYTMKNMNGTFTIDGKSYDGSDNGTFTPTNLTNNFMVMNEPKDKPMILEGNVTSKELPYFSGMQSVSIPTLKLTNLAPQSNNVTIQNYEGNANILLTSEITPTQQLKSGVMYTVFFKVENLSSPKTSNIMYQGVDTNDKFYKYTAFSSYKLKDGWNKITLTVNQSLSIKTISLLSYGIFETGGGATILGNSIMIIEGDYTNQDIPYFEGAKSFNMPVLTTYNSNIFPFKEYIEGTGATEDEDYIYVNGTFNEFTIPLKTDGGIYTLYIDGEITEHDNFGEWNYDYEDGTSMEFYMSPPNLSKDTLNKKLVGIRCRNPFGAVFKLKKSSLCFNLKSIGQEPYKTNILSTPQDLELRGIGNIKDTLDCITGDVTERIGEVVLNGSENWMASGNNNALSNINYIQFYWKDSSSILKNKRSMFMCDKIIVKPFDDWMSSWNNMSLAESFIVLSATNELCIRVPYSCLNKQDVNGFKEWLQQNPITVQYQLATESIKTVDLSVTNQNNESVNKLQSFKDGYIQYSSISKTSLAPSMSYEVPTKNSYYVDLLKPSTSYTMKNMNGTFTIDENQYEGSVNGTFTSPETLTNKFLVSSDKQGKHMILNGDLTTKELPYFSGVQSANIPTLKLINDMDYIWNNLVKQDQFNYVDNELIILNNGYHDGRTWDEVAKIPNLKPLTTYTMMFTKGSSPTVEFATIDDIGTMKMLATFRDAQKMKIITPSNGDLRVKFSINNPSASESTINLGQVIFVEGDFTNVNIPYSEFLKSPVLKTTGANLVNPKDITVFGCDSYEVTDEGIANITGDTTGYWAKSYMAYECKLTANKTYYIYCDGESTGRVHCSGFIDEKDSGIIRFNGFQKYIPEKDVIYKARIFFNKDAGPFTASRMRLAIFECETQPSGFEPYNANTVTVKEEITLRSLPNGIKDSLNLKTGELVQNIGEVVLNGTESWTYGNTVNDTDLVRFSTGRLNDIGLHETVVACDKMTSVVNWNPTDENIYHSNTNNGIVIIKSGINDVDSLTKWLSQNPLKVQYQLLNPIIKKVDISVLDKDNKPTDHLHSFSNGYIQLTSNGLIPSVKYEVPTTNSYYLPLMTNSGKYTAKNINGTITIDGEELNITDNSVFTSPNTLTNKILVINDPQDKPMIIDGDATNRNIPYFTGVQSVDTPVLKTSTHIFDFGKGGKLQ